MTRSLINLSFIFFFYFFFNKVFVDAYTKRKKKGFCYRKEGAFNWDNTASVATPHGCNLGILKKKKRNLKKVEGKK